VARGALAVLVTDARNADLPRWQAAVRALPAAQPARVLLAADTVTFGAAGDIDATAHAVVEDALRALHPWRKGPFDFFGVQIDTEWRSDWKWQRVATHLAPLAGRRVLDVGCGSGYHLWRMRGAGAAFVLGIDPALLYFAQFAAAKRYASGEPVFFAPVKLEDLPPHGATFDTVFSMGVIYHRRDPLAHLAELAAALRDGGELVLETLVVEGDEDTVLEPPGRYAQMRNVLAIPSPAALLRWLREAGFSEARIVDVTSTTTAEQRKTGWMTFLSLADFLDPSDPSRTVEGHPAPVRAVAIARKPSVTGAEQRS
jgi:tRNA (mo5U34)-methyltransferase